MQMSLIFHRPRARFAVAILIAVMFVLLFGWATNVPAAVTEEDEATFRSLGFSPPTRPLTYVEEIELIKRLHSFVIDRFPHAPGIPEYRSREPKDLEIAGRGLCFDRSRYIEKLLAFHGFKTRHVFVIFLDSEGLDPNSGVSRR